MRELVVETNVYVLELPQPTDKGIIYGTVAQGQNALQIRTTEAVGLRAFQEKTCRVLGRMTTGADRTGRRYETLEIDKVIPTGKSNA